MLSAVTIRLSLRVWADILCDDIAERSKVIEANLEKVRVYEEKQERKEQNRNDKRR